MSKLDILSFNEKEINILIVEDEIILALCMEESLKKMGYYVCTIANDAKSALQAAKNFLPDIVIMDINLHNSSGIDAANDIWKSLKIPIIFLTSYSNDKTITKAMECEPYGYLIKPCKDKELKASIIMALHKHKYFFLNHDTKTKSNKLIYLEEDFIFDKSKSILYKNNEKIKLTKNEKKLFEILSEEPNEIQPFNKIYNYIYREEFHDIGKLRTLIYRLRQKLNINPLENIYESGYKLKVKKIA